MDPSLNMSKSEFAISSPPRDDLRPRASTWVDSATIIRVPWADLGIPLNLPLLLHSYRFHLFPPLISITSSTFPLTHPPNFFQDHLSEMQK